MGFLRHLGIVIASILLFLLLIAGGIFATLNYSLSYENVQPNINSIAEKIVEEQIGSNELVNQLMPFMQTICQTESEVIQKFGNYTLVIPCEIINLGGESIIDYSINYIIEDFYYKEYNCSFTGCFKESEVPLFLVSLHAKSYWKSLFYKTLIAIIVLALLILILAEKRSNGFILIGSLSLISSLIILKLKGIGTTISEAILSPVSQALSEGSSRDIISQITTIFFSESSRVFLWMFATGIILIVFGIILKITTLGIKIDKKIEEIKNRNKIEDLEEKTNKLEKQLKQKKGNK